MEDFFLRDVDGLACHGMGDVRRGPGGDGEGAEASEGDLSGIDDVIGCDVQDSLEKTAA